MCNLDFEPPSSNTGVQNSQHLEKSELVAEENPLVVSPKLATFCNVQNTLKVDLIIDWFQCTIKGYNVMSILEDFGIELTDPMITCNQGGLFGYDTTYCYGEKIKFMVSSKDFLRSEKEQMGVCILLSGKGCREFEVKWSWHWLLFYVYENKANLGRIDLAWDAYTDQLFTISRMRRALRRACIVSWAKTALEYSLWKLSDGIRLGETVSIGKSSSETSVCFYNKLQERACNNYIVDADIKHWYRCELRLRKFSANKFLEEYVNAPTKFSELALGVLNNYMSIKAERDTNPNRSRRRNADWWDEFIGNAGKVSLAEKAVQSTITRKKDWIELGVNKSLAMVFLADLDDMHAEELQRFIKDGISKVKGQDLAMINKYRLDKGGSVLSQSDIEYVKKMLFVEAEYLPFKNV